MTDAAIKRMLQASPIGFASHKIVLDESGRPADYVFLEVNKAFENLTGLSASRITGKNVTEVIPGIKDSSFDWIGFYGRIALQGGDESFEQYSEPLGRWYRVQAYSEEKGLFSTFFLDISGMKNDGKEQEEQHRFQQIAAETSALFSGISTSAEFDIGINRTLEALGQFFGADRSYLFMFSEDLVLMSNTHEWCSDNVESASERIQDVPIDSLPWWKQQIMEKKHVFIPDVGELPEEAVAEKIEFSAQGIQSLLSLPLYNVKGKFSGFIGFDMIKDTYFWTHEQIGMLKVIGGIIGNTIERLRTEEKRKESEEKLRQVTDNIQEVFWLRSADNSKILYISPSYEKVWGRTCESIYADPLSFMDSVHEGDKEKVFREFEKYAKTDEFDLEYRIVTPGGETRWVHARSFPVRDENGAIIRHTGIAADITKRIQKEKELAEEKRQTENFFNQSLHGFFICMLDEPVEWNEETDKDAVLEYVLDHQRMTRVNQAMLDQYGAAEEDFIGITVRELFRHDLDHAREIWRGLFDKGSWHVETREQKMDGTPIIIDGDYKCLYDDHGRFMGHFGVQVDVTAQKEAEKTIRDSQEQIRQILATTPAVVYTYFIDRIGRPDLLFVNRKVKEVLGYEPDHFIGNIAFWTECVHPDDLEKVMSGVSSLREKTALEIEYRFRDSQGNWRWLMDRHSVTERKDNGVLVTGAWYDITERKNMEAEMQHQSGLITSLLDSIPDIIYYKDKNGAYLGCNPPFAAFVGKPREEIIGKTEYDLFERSVADSFREYDQKMLEDLKPRHSEEWITYPDGRRILIDTLRTPYWGPNGQLMGLLGISRDITRHKKTEEQLVIAKEQAEAASKAKSLFLANMSHEIRTPLNGVIGYTNLLEKTPLNSVQKLYTENVKVSGKTLLAIINDILDLSKIEADKLDLEIRETDIRALLHEVAGIMEVQASKKKLELLVDLPLDLPPLVLVDPVRLRQIVTNLLSNAIKFTEHGEVELKLVFQAGKEGTGKFIFSVRDTGIGISERQKDKLFQSFTQADSSTTRKYGGTGLGLAISRRLVEKMGGQIRLDSVEGEGSTFSFSLEAAYRMNEQTTQQKPVSSVVKKVLVIDDNASNRNILEATLTHWKVDCRSCESGRSALKLMDSEEFDLLIVDYHMPEMNGLETVQAIREKYQSDKDNMPITLLYSSSDDPILKEKSNELGIRHTLIKPVNTNELHECIRNIQFLQKEGKIAVGEPGNVEEGTHHKTQTDAGEVADQDVRSQDQPTVDARFHPAVPDSVTPETDSEGENVRDSQKQQPAKETATILIVEDVPMNMHLVKALIGSLYPGLSLLEACNGLEAIEIVKKEKIDLVLMDIQMPEMDGLEATELIRKWEGDQDAETRLPVIALTAGALKEEKDRALKCGMDDFLTKPIEPESIQAAFEEYLTSDKLVSK